MSYRTKMSIIILLSQLIFFILNSIIFFNDVEKFLAFGNDYRINVVVIFGISQFIYLLLVIITNKNDKLDERNKRLETTSAGTTFVTMMIASFISLQYLYVINIDEGQIPIYWLWYLAFAYFSFASIIFTISNLLIPLLRTKYED
ncbi:MAG: hypothetical protein WC152_01910 [Candidatus Izemoplasmatales bacterium]|nr:hypothetical protein [Candidatus Izemoplasmatales bacterium]